MPFNFFKKDPEKAAAAQRRKEELKASRKSEKSARNPFLDARSEWNGVNGALISSRTSWMVVCLFALLIALASVAGVISIGSQSKFIPYVVEVDKAGTTIGGGVLDTSPRATRRIQESFAANFIIQARMVTADSLLQKKALDNVFNAVKQNTPAAAKLQEFFMSSPEASPFVRAQKVLVDVRITSVIAASDLTWEIEWVETTRGRDGSVISTQAMRALLTEEMDPASVTDQAAVIRNPLGIYVSDFSWNPRMN